LFRAITPFLALAALVISLTALADDSPLLVGQPPPAITLNDLGGQAVTLEGLEGKVVLVDFWASWCVPCRAELPLLVELQKKHAEQGLVVLAINVDERAKDRDKYLGKHPLELTILDDSAQATVASYQVKKMPTSVLVDRGGNIAAVHYGFTSEQFEELEGQIEDLLE
jgi:cytochrome c biogenesis protein CcmG/thiol:disulfide interchange protein DsbE